MRRGSFIVAMGVLVFVGTALRWWALGQSSLWFDEGYTAWVSSLPASRLIEAVKYDLSPPLYFLYIHFWRYLAGDTELALRFLSALAATAAIPLVAAIAWQATSSRVVTVLATGIFALSQIQVEWSHTARNYAIASFLFTLAVFALIRYLQGARYRWLAVASVTAAALVYHHNLMWLYLGGLLLGAMLWPSEMSIRKRLLSLGAMLLCVALCFAPWIPGFLQQLAAQRRAYFTEPPVLFEVSYVLVLQSGIHLERLGQLSAETLGIADPSQRLYRIPLLAAVAGLMCVAVAHRERALRWRMIALGGFALAPIGAAFAYSHLSKSIWVEKGFIPTSALLPILIGSAWISVRSAMGRAIVGGAIASVALLAGITSLDYLLRPPLEDWRGGLKWIGDSASSDSMALFVATEGEMLYEYYASQIGLPEIPCSGAPRSFYSTDPPLMATRVNSTADLESPRKSVASAGRIFLVQAYTGWADPHRYLQKWLDSEYRLVGSYDGGRVTVRWYEPTRMTIATTQPALQQGN